MWRVWFEMELIDGSVVEIFEISSAYPREENCRVGRECRELQRLCSTSSVITYNRPARGSPCLTLFSRLIAAVVPCRVAMYVWDAFR